MLWVLLLIPVHGSSVGSRNFEQSSSGALKPADDYSAGLRPCSITTNYCVEGFRKDSNRCVRKQSMMLCQGTSGTSSGTMTEERYQAIKTENEKRILFAYESINDDLSHTLTKLGFEAEISNGFYELSEDSASIKFEVKTDGERGTCLIVYELPIIRKNPCGADPAVHCGFSETWRLTEAAKEGNKPPSLIIDDDLSDNKDFDCICLTKFVGNREAGFKGEQSYARYKQAETGGSLLPDQFVCERFEPCTPSEQRELGCAPSYSLAEKSQRLSCVQETLQCVGVNYDADNQVRSYDWQNFKEVLQSPISALAYPSELVGVAIPVLPGDCLSHTCRINIYARFGGKMYMTNRVGKKPDEKPFCEQLYVLQVSSRVDYCSGDCFDNLLQKRSRSEHLIYRNFMCDKESTQCVHPTPYHPEDFDCVCKDGYQPVGSCAGTDGALDCISKRDDVHWRSQFVCAPLESRRAFLVCNSKHHKKAKSWNYNEIRENSRMDVDEETWGSEATAYASCQAISPASLPILRTVENTRKWRPNSPKFLTDSWDADSPNPSNHMLTTCTETGYTADMALAKPYPDEITDCEDKHGDNAVNLECCRIRASEVYRKVFCKCNTNPRMLSSTKDFEKMGDHQAQTFDVFTQFKSLYQRYKDVKISGRGHNSDGKGSKYIRNVWISLEDKRDGEMTAWWTQVGTHMDGVKWEIDKMLPGRYHDMYREIRVMNYNECGCAVDDIDCDKNLRKMYGSRCSKFAQCRDLEKPESHTHPYIDTSAHLNQKHSEIPFVSTAGKLDAYEDLLARLENNQAYQRNEWEWLPPLYYGFASLYNVTFHPLADKYPFQSRRFGYYCQCPPGLKRGHVRNVIWNIKQLSSQVKYRSSGSKRMHLKGNGFSNLDIQKHGVEFGSGCFDSIDPVIDVFKKIADRCDEHVEEHLQENQLESDQHLVFKHGVTVPNVCAGVERCNTHQSSLCAGNGCEPLRLDVLRFIQVHDENKQVYDAKNKLNGRQYADSEEDIVKYSCANDVITMKAQWSDSPSHLRTFQNDTKRVFATGTKPTEGPDEDEDERLFKVFVDATDGTPENFARVASDANRARRRQLWAIAFPTIQDFDECRCMQSGACSPEVEQEYGARCHKDFAWCGNLDQEDSATQPFISRRHLKQYVFHTGVDQNGRAYDETTFRKAYYVDFLNRLQEANRTFREVTADKFGNSGQRFGYFCACKPGLHRTNRSQSTTMQIGNGFVEEMRFGTGCYDSLKPKIDLFESGAPDDPIAQTKSLGIVDRRCFCDSNVAQLCPSQGSCLPSKERILSHVDGTDENNGQYLDFPEDLPVNIKRNVQIKWPPVSLTCDDLKSRENIHWDKVVANNVKDIFAACVNDRSKTFAYEITIALNDSVPENTAASSVYPNFAQERTIVYVVSYVDVLGEIETLKKMVNGTAPTSKPSGGGAGGGGGGGDDPQNCPKACRDTLKVVEEKLEASEAAKETLSKDLRALQTRVRDLEDKLIKLAKKVNEGEGIPTFETGQDARKPPDAVLVTEDAESDTQEKRTFMPILIVTLFLALLAIPRLLSMILILTPFDLDSDTFRYGMEGWYRIMRVHPDDIRHMVERDLEERRDGGATHKIIPIIVCTLILCLAAYLVLRPPVALQNLFGILV